jgi:hypothetical protein
MYELLKTCVLRKSYIYTLVKVVLIMHTLTNIDESIKVYLRADDVFSVGQKYATQLTMYFQ